MSYMSKGVEYSLIEEAYKCSILCVENDNVIGSVIRYARGGEIVKDESVGDEATTTKITNSLEYKKRTNDLLEFTKNLSKLAIFPVTKGTKLKETRYFTVSAKHIQFCLEEIESLSFEIAFDLRVPCLFLVYFRGQYIEVQSDDQLSCVYELISKWLIDHGTNRLKLY